MLHYGGSPLLAAGIQLIALCLFSLTAHAVPIRSYQFDVRFDCVGPSGGDESACGHELGGVLVGVSYTGQFTVAESLFDTDGYKDVGFDTFFFALADTVWDSTRPCRTVGGSDFCGTRGFNPETRQGGFVPWTLLVQNHELSNICCGVFGIMDSPFVDLLPAGWDINLGPPLGANYAAVTAFFRTECPTPGASQCQSSLFGRGTYSLQRVSEPGTLALIALGFGGLLLLRRRAVDPVR
jgi:hypothetical protein